MWKQHNLRGGSSFDGNLENRVRVVGVKPVFIKYAVDGMHEQRQFLEVEELLDHLFRLVYTPAHVTKRVIPPFVNPFTFLHPICGGCLQGSSTTAHVF